jgi:integrase
MHERTGSCPKCGSARCHIVIYRDGAKRRYFKDTQGNVFSYMSALSQLLAMSREEGDPNAKFNHADWRPEKVKERRFDMMLERWLAQKKSEVESEELSFGTYHAYNSYSKNYLIPKLGAMNVRKIGFAELEEFKDGLPKALKLKTKRIILNTLHTAMKWMWRKGVIIVVPPFPVVKGNDTAVKVALSMEDQYTALSQIPAEHRDVYEFEYETGLRPGETCALKIKDLDLSANTLRVQRTFTMRRLRESDKEGHRKALPLSPRALELAQAHAQGRFPEDWLFINPANGNHYTVHRLGLYWKQYTKLPCTHYEATRHSFCTQIAEVADRAAAQDLMRHADGRSTDRYIHARTEYLRDVLAKRGKVAEIKKHAEMGSSRAVKEDKPLKS